MGDEILHNWEKKSKENTKAYRTLLKRANKNTVLKELGGLTEQAYQAVDCLSCAACCKNYSPRFKTTDIKRIAKYLKLKESVFIDQYLRVDEDGDFVFYGENNWLFDE